jgi:hypothetical protein
LKNYKSPGSDLILAELIHVEGEIHKLINFIWNKEELPDQWKEYIIVPIYKKGNKTGHGNYCEISVLSATYKILCKILLSGLRPDVDEIIWYHRCGV